MNETQKGRQVISPIGQGSPERSAEKFDERPKANEKAALSGVHAHLFKVYTHKREQGAKGRVKEEVEGLDGEELLIDGAEQILQDIAPAANLMGGLLRFGIQVGIDLTLSLRIHYRPDGTRCLRQNSTRLRGCVVRHSIVVILVSIVLHDFSVGLSFAALKRNPDPRPRQTRQAPRARELANEQILLPTFRLGPFASRRTDAFRQLLS